MGFNMKQVMMDTVPVPEPEEKISNRSLDRLFVGMSLGSLILAGGFAYLAEIGDNTEGRQNAVVAQTCLDAYPSYDSSVTDAAVKCMKYGWVPGTESLSDSEGFKADMPKALVEGYIVTQNEAANNINVLAVGGWAVAGLVGGVFLSASIIGSYEDAEKRKAQNINHQ